MDFHRNRVEIHVQCMSTQDSNKTLLNSLHTSRKYMYVALIGSTRSEVAMALYIYIHTVYA